MKKVELSNVFKIKPSFSKEVVLKSIPGSDLEFSYSKVDIGRIQVNISVKTSFCDYSKFKLDNSLKSLSLRDSYSKVHIELSDNLAAAYEISTSYGAFIDKTNIDFERTDTPSKYTDLNRRYRGKSGSGSIKIDIKSSLGNLRIGKGSESDMKEKKKVRT